MVASYLCTLWESPCAAYLLAGAYESGYPIVPGESSHALRSSVIVPTSCLSVLLCGFSYYLSSRLLCYCTSLYLVSVVCGSRLNFSRFVHRDPRRAINVARCSKGSSGVHWSIPLARLTRHKGTTPRVDLFTCSRPESTLPSMGPNVLDRGDMVLKSIVWHNH